MRVRQRAGIAGARTRAHRKQRGTLPELSRFGDLFQHHPQPMWIYDLETLRFLRVNDAACAHYGYSSAEFLAMTIRDIRPPSELARLAADLAASPSTRPQQSGSWTHIKKNGKRIAVRISSHALSFAGRRCRLVFALDVTDQLRTEQALHRSEQLHRSLIDTMPHQIFWKDRALRYIGGNLVFAAAAGLPDTASVNGTCDSDFPWRAEAGRIAAEDRDVVESGLPLLEREHAMPMPDGSVQRFLVNKLPLHGPDGEIIGLLGTIENISARKQAEQLLRLQSRALDASVNAIVIARVDSTGHLVEYANSAFERMTGYPLAEVLGCDCRLLQGSDQDQHGLRQVRHALRQRSEVTVVLRNYRKDGSLFWNRLHLAPVADPAGAVTHWVGVMDDISASIDYQRELEHQSHHDALTGLPNRTLFNTRLERAIADAMRSAQPLWIVFIDLDNFKLVNDTLGHNTGDLLLQAVAARLRGALRECDTVARLGGDEFMLLLPQGTGDGLSRQPLRQLLDTVSAPLRLGQHELAPACSIGVAVYPQDGETGATLLQHADIALYRAKDAGRGQVQFYAPEMNARLTERTLIEGHLRHAIVRDEFSLHFQPRVDGASGQVLGVEALLRWNHPQLGSVSPARFIHIAEETGRIVEIGEWVLRTACAQNRAWQRAGLRPVPVAVNVSARQFRHAHFSQQVLDALADSGLDPRWLELELTESVVMQNVDSVVAMLGELKQLGITLSIDDFGTGYSSLNYLRRFPLDYLKIDQSFVRDMLTDPPGAAIVRSIIMLGHSLGFRIIAEGVETPAQLAYLLAEGCDEIQGYLFSRPVPADAAARLIAGGALTCPDGGASPATAPL